MGTQKTASENLSPFPPRKEAHHASRVTDAIPMMPLPSLFVYNVLLDKTLAE
jgi:hypothetical protein